MEYVYDSPMWTEERKILTSDTLPVPGMEVFGYNRSSKKPYLLPPHLHKTIEFLCIGNGAQKYYIRNQEYLVHGNQVLIVDPDVPHSSGSTPYGRYEHFWFRLDPALFCAAAPSASIRTMLQQRLSFHSTPLLTLGDNQYSLLADSFYDLASGDALVQLRGCAEFLRFLTDLLLSSDQVLNCSPVIRQVQNHIDSNIRTYISLSQLAELSGLSLAAFKQKFHQETGISPREYINLKKIEEAKKLLTAGYSVTDTAFELDFSSSSYFSVLFRQITGLSPKEFIRACKPSAPDAP